MPSKIFDLPEIGQVKIYKRRGANGLRISISPSNGVRVTEPMWLPYKAALEFAQSRKDWIIKNLPKQTYLIHDRQIGKAHRLKFQSSMNTSRITGHLLRNEARVTHPATMDLSNHKLQQAARRIATKALTKEAQALLPQRLSQLSKDHGFNYNSVKIKRLSSRWGSCSAEKDIILNCFLMQLPWELIDYVLLHELMHTQVLAHGKPFWAALEKHVPNLADIRKTMRTHQPTFV
ncbi:MAG TPA: SprT family zinc-dependent metalloprotease [Patescibacteria group bacterium]|nr:SprT family zinc-dependent metalloprotease [Patescibacteria group bacterium]